MPIPDDHRRALWDALGRYCLRTDSNLEAARAILRFIESSPDCFSRSHAPGHITGSCLLLNPSGDKTLLTLHRKLKRWLQPGGHADGECDALALALREAREESGIEEIVTLESEIFDVDIHLIPARPQSGEPEHLHYDIRYLMRAAHEDFVCSDESDELAWMTAAQIREMGSLFDEALLRMLRLWEARA